ncbi:hypothetical protein DJ568_02495 [Mucilaginibacter hurinus]|uniref:DUF3857 domain-containing protein n=1 Tax=Mucilaginibacter hurinus TaxID=2201324 RepID=A0A367GVP6_9SPHI|nr:DUF3857 domain-containing protein [Mucilaginibacter hurinus]RCH56743.1 hypothetical protein DJ568_02495 [Mucilaginibacter hurinus]
MKLRHILSVYLFVLFTCMAATAQVLVPELYKASTIPDSLKEDANAVIRYNINETIIKGPAKVINKTHSVVTALNEHAEDAARLMLFYDKGSSVNSFVMNIYNAEGIFLKKYKKSDMYDRSAISGGTIVTDARLKFINHVIASYPCTVEMIYEEESNNSLHYNSWYLQQPDRSVQDDYCKITVSAGTTLRYANKNTNIAPQVTKSGDGQVYTWHVANLKATKKEDGVPAWRVTPRVDFSAAEFQYDGYAGNLSTWESFGKWIVGLNSDVNTLPPARAAEIQQMVAHLSTDKEKARFLYEYMQKNMRYVSIQLGIGGFKPFSASFVDEKKYGDCKALSNYMYALLKAVNIPANYALIRAGVNGEPADAGFSRNSFNHAILCIPFKGDTTWLECTSTTTPFGVLGNFTENRNALLITDEGGKLVNTPKSKSNDNVFTADVNIKLYVDGGATCKMKIDGTGEYREEFLGLARHSVDEQKTELIKSIKLKQPSSFGFNDGDDIGGKKQVILELEYDKYCDVTTGDKKFYRPAAFDLWAFTLPASEKHKTDYYFEHPMQRNCTTTIDLPEGFELETLPANQSLKCAYGSYDIKYNYDAAKNQVISTAAFVLNNYVIPAAKYPEMRQYFDAVAKAQNKKLVIRRKA